MDIYGRVRIFEGRSLNDCPFRYQGQYEDSETGLYYNRFRYYDPSTGIYLSQDPIGLHGGMQLYSYVHDTNGWVDVFGLDVYELRAKVDGWYPVYEKGQLDPTSYERLNEGEVYKISESKNPSKRYSEPRLNEARINKSTATSVAVDANGKVKLDGKGKIVPAELKIKTVSLGNTKAVDRILEYEKIKKLEHQRGGRLPAGNKTHH